MKQALVISCCVVLLLSGCIDSTTEPENTPPSAEIISPTDNSSFTESETITFRGRGEDLEDGKLTGSSLVWKSSIDGQIGVGEEFSRDNLSLGSHTITLTATDSEGLSGEDVVMIDILIDVSVSITAPEDGDIFVVGYPVPCLVEISPEDEVETIQWKLNGNSVNCSNGEIVINETGDHNLSVEVLFKDGRVVTDAVNIKVLPVFNGKIYPVDGGNVSGTVYVRANGITESVEIGMDGTFSLPTTLIGKNSVEIYLQPDNNYYPSYVSEPGSKVIEMSEGDGVKFAGIPYIWNITTGLHAGESIEISIEDAFDRAGRENISWEAFYWLFWGQLASALEKDLPLRVFFDRANSNREITPEDSITFWVTMDSLHLYLGMGEFFVPAAASDVDNINRFVALRVDSTQGPTGGPRFAEGDNNITGGQVNIGRVEAFDTANNPRIVWHEFIHVMGLGHTCLWPTVMYRSGCPPGSPLSTLHPSRWDVAYIQLLYATRQIQYDESIPYGIEESYEALGIEW